jgi:hypothetical protein
MRPQLQLIRVSLSEASYEKVLHQAVWQACTCWIIGFLPTTASRAAPRPFKELVSKRREVIQEEEARGKLSSRQPAHPSTLP